MMLRVDHDSAIPVYEQLRDQMLRLAVGGWLQPGQRLPTIRQLSSDLTLAKGTVERAYEQLERDGVILRRGAAGSFVVERLPSRSLDEANEALHREAQRFVTSARQLAMSDDDILAALHRVMLAHPEPPAAPPQ